MNRSATFRGEAAFKAIKKMTCYTPGACAIKDLVETLVVEGLVDVGKMTFTIDSLSVSSNHFIMLPLLGPLGADHALSVGYAMGAARGTATFQIVDDKGMVRAAMSVQYANLLTLSWRM